MVFVFEIQKQGIKNFNDPSYGYGAIHENVLKLRRFAQLHSKKYFDFTPYCHCLSLAFISSQRSEVKSMSEFKLKLHHPTLYLSKSWSIEVNVQAKVKSSDKIWPKFAMRCHEIDMRLPWECLEIAMRMPLDCHEITMRWLWD